MAELNARTATYREPPPGSAPAARRPVVLVGRLGSAGTDDLYQLLRRRLIVLSYFLAAVVSFLVVLSFLVEPFVEALIANGRWYALVGTHLAAAWVLKRRPPATVVGLRALEFLILGPCVVLLLVMGVSDFPYDPLEEAARLTGDYRDAVIGRYANTGRYLWLLVIVCYGAIVPNTVRRAAVVVGAMAAAPLILFAVFAYAVRPLDPDVAGTVLYLMSSSNLIAVALVLFSTSRIEILRHEAAEARKLGQYVLHEKLGAGGMGEVYRAEHALLRRPAALKLIRPEKAGDPAMLRRFEREVQTTATLTHPNTVQVFDYGHAADGTFYYVMEYLPGLTLDDLVRRFGPLPPGRAVHFLRQVCGALGEAHARGLTHRDIKPGNVMVCERGGRRDVAKVLDFGLVHVPKDAADGGTLTREGTIAGTPAYMSPEQAGGEAGIDPRSDLYGVGALAYFLLTGRPPFAGRSAARMLAAHLYEPPAALPAEVPPPLAAVVMRCLAKAPAERYADAGSLDAALAAAPVPTWTADEAAAWWARSEPARGTAPIAATATWAEPGDAPDPAA